MVVVTIHREKDSVQGFSVKGHAGYAERGKDIICAGISAITQTAVIGLIKVLNIEVDVIQKQGFLSCMLPEDLDSNTYEKAEAILETMILGLKEIQREYNEFITIKEKHAKEV